MVDKERGKENLPVWLWPAVANMSCPICACSASPMASSNVSVYWSHLYFPPSLSLSHVFLSRSFCVWCESHALQEQGPNRVQVTKCLHAGSHTKSNDTSWKYKATWAALQIVRWLLSEYSIRSAAKNKWRKKKRKQRTQHCGCHVWSSYWSVLRLSNMILSAFS